MTAWSAAFAVNPPGNRSLSIGVSADGGMHHLKKIDTKPEAYSALVGSSPCSIFSTGSPTIMKMVATLAQCRRSRRALSPGRENSARRSNTPTSAARLAPSIQGGDEKAKGEVQIKDLDLPIQRTISSIKDREEYKASKPKRRSPCRGADLARRRAPRADAAGVGWRSRGTSSRWPRRVPWPLTRPRMF